jgi:16S rRNA (uracil1498-N3)-methyltransferase
VRVFVDKNAINGDSIIIGEKDCHHIWRVMRMKQGDRIVVCGDGMEYDCELIGDNEARILDERVSSEESEMQVVLFQGVPKQSKMDGIVQQCTELGVSEICPIITKFGEGQVGNKLDRWNKIAEESAKQCGRGRIPRVTEALDFAEACKRIGEFDWAIIPYEKAGVTDIIGNIEGKQGCIFIGSEGGFSESEVELAVLYGARIVTLGERILRTQTAGAAVLAKIFIK